MKAQHPKIVADNGIIVVKRYGRIILRTKISGKELFAITIVEAPHSPFFYNKCNCYLRVVRGCVTYKQTV